MKKKTNEFVDENQTLVETESAIEAYKSYEFKPHDVKLCNSRYIRVRKLPTATSDIVATCDFGTIVTAISHESGYYKVQTAEGLTGYVVDRYVSEG